MWKVGPCCHFIDLVYISRRGFGIRLPAALTSAMKPRPRIQVPYLAVSGGHFLIYAHTLGFGFQMLPVLTTTSNGAPCSFILPVVSPIARQLVDRCAQCSESGSQLHRLGIDFCRMGGVAFGAGGGIGALDSVGD